MTVTRHRARLPQHPADPSFRYLLQPQAAADRLRSPPPSLGAYQFGRAASPQDLLVQHLVRRPAFEPCVLLLQRLQLTSHLRIYPAVLHAPTIERLLADRKLLTNFGNLFPLPQGHSRLEAKNLQSVPQHVASSCRILSGPTGRLDSLILSGSVFGKGVTQSNRERISTVRAAECQNMVRFAPVTSEGHLETVPNGRETSPVTG